MLKEKAEQLNAEEEDDGDTSINKEGPNVLSKSLFKSMIRDRDDATSSVNLKTRARVPHLNYYNGKNRSQTIIQKKDKMMRR